MQKEKRITEELNSCESERSGKPKVWQMPNEAGINEANFVKI